MYATTFMVVLRCVWEQFTEKNSELSIAGTTVAASDIIRSSLMINVKVGHLEIGMEATHTPVIVGA
ncbi:hypothetical protein D3C80_2156790 [compost metagenome]